MDGLDPSKCTIELEICETVNGNLHLIRRGRYLTIQAIDVSKDYILPREYSEAQQYIFGINNEETIDSLLGSFYIDQDHGWSLLNRGRVIGASTFYIDRFLISFCNDETKNLKTSKDALTKELERYRSLSKLFDRKKNLDNFARDDVDTTTIEDIQIKINTLEVSLKQLKSEHNRLTQSKIDNKHFMDYIAGLKLVICIDDKEVPLTPDMIVPANDNMNIIDAKLRLIETSMSKVQDQIENAREKLARYTELDNFDAIVQSYDVTPLSKTDLDIKKVDAAITRLNGAIKDCSIEINNNIQSSTVISRLDEIIKRNASELGIDHYIRRSNNPSLIQNLIFKVSSELIHFRNAL